MDHRLTDAVIRFLLEQLGKIIKRHIRLYAIFQIQDDRVPIRLVTPYFPRSADSR
jgi:hypothetical protein